MALLRNRSTFAIAISGSSGAGKTTLVKRVADLLADAVALHFDDYQPVATYPTDLTAWIEQGRDLNQWQIPQLLTDLQALQAGRTIRLPRSLTEVQPAKYIVLEEPSGRIRQGLRELVDFAVFVEIPLDIALARKVVEYLTYCEQEFSGETLRNALQQAVTYYAQYPIHREYYLTVIEQARQDCDLLLDGTRSVDELAEAIVDAVRPLATA